MKYSTARQGRVFVVRLESGDILHECIEGLAAREGIRCGFCVALGGAAGGSRLVVGPEERVDDRVVPQLVDLCGIHEYGGVGTIFPDESGAPVLHMHAACGRGESSRVGCVRAGVDTWLVGEVVVVELLDCDAVRARHDETGFDLLEP